MKDEDILAKLYELQDLPGGQHPDYISAWIRSTQMDMADDAARNIGFGSAMKAMKKIIKSNEKKNPELAYMLRTNHKHRFILTDKAMAICFRNNFELPCTSLQKDYADRIMDRIAKEGKMCTKALTTPSRAELDVLIKDWKATPKNKRTSVPLYSFGKDIPYYDAQKLFDMLPMFPTCVCYYNPMKSISSPLYFKWEMVIGILLPVRKN